MSNVSKVCYIVGIDKAGNVENANNVRLVFAKYDSSLAPNARWAFSKKVAKQAEVVKMIKSGQLKIENATVDDSGSLVGTTGSLARFNSCPGFHPIVVIGEMKVKDDGDGRLVGYKIVCYDGKVKSIRANEVISYCETVNKSNTGKDNVKYPIQNMIYLAASDGRKAAIRGYEANQLICDYIELERAKTAEPAKVSVENNTKQVSRLEEIFTADQIEQLKIGKQHNVNIRLYGNKDLSAEQMKVLREALEDGVDIKPFAGPEFSADKMKAYAINAKYGTNIGLFVNKDYTVGQIYTLSTAILDGLNIKEMADPKLSVDDMGKIASRLTAEMYNVDEISVIELLDRFA